MFPFTKRLLQVVQEVECDVWHDAEQDGADDRDEQDDDDAEWNVQLTFVACRAEEHLCHDAEIIEV